MNSLKKEKKSKRRKEREEKKKKKKKKKEIAIPTEAWEIFNPFTVSSTTATSGGAFNSFLLKCDPLL